MPAFIQNIQHTDEKTIHYRDVAEFRDDFCSIPFLDISSVKQCGMFLQCKTFFPVEIVQDKQYRGNRP